MDPVSLPFMKTVGISSSSSLQELYPATTTSQNNWEWPWNDIGWHSWVQSTSSHGSGFVPSSKCYQFDPPSPKTSLFHSRFPLWSLASGIPEEWPYQDRPIKDSSMSFSSSAPELFSSRSMFSVTLPMLLVYLNKPFLFPFISRLCT